MNEIFIIKDCPECGKQLRFPIDKGTIKVKCPCGYVFTADPDNTNIYKNARFDLNNKRPPDKPPLKDKIMRGIWQYKYNFQNIRLLTGKTRLTTIIVMGLIILFLLSIVCLIIILAAPQRKYII